MGLFRVFCVMGKKVTDFNPQEICELAWNEMDQKQRNLTTSVTNLKNEYLVLVEDQFVQQYHDVG